MMNWWDFIVAILKAFFKFEEGKREEAKAIQDKAEAAQEEENVETEAKINSEIQTAHQEVDNAADPRAALRKQFLDDGLLK